ncbi:MAG: HU family DNA-binding protein [Acidobacteria bacterium]|nr:HU family DNA-binding protein [Acidobacteriota bacterium]MCH8128865.1 HU family DNA-binding protein [Acidobacteriota bacterium]
MNKGELIEAVARNTGESKALTAKMIDETLDVIMGGVVTQGKVQITGFGTFEGRDRKARTARNPQTGAPVYVPATRVPAFKAGQNFKDRVKPG